MTQLQQNQDTPAKRRLCVPFAARLEAITHWTLFSLYWTAYTTRIERIVPQRLYSSQLHENVDTPSNTISQLDHQRHAQTCSVWTLGKERPCTVADCFTLHCWTCYWIHHVQWMDASCHASKPPETNMISVASASQTVALHPSTYCTMDHPCNGQTNQRGRCRQRTECVCTLT